MDVLVLKKAWLGSSLCYIDLRVKTVSKSIDLNKSIHSIIFGSTKHVYNGKEEINTLLNLSGFS